MTNMARRFRQAEAVTDPDKIAAAAVVSAVAPAADKTLDVDQPPRKPKGSRKMPLKSGKSRG